MVLTRKLFTKKYGVWTLWAIMQWLLYTATVAVHINRLREKIEDDPSDPHYIETVWGAGYRFKA